MLCAVLQNLEQRSHDCLEVGDRHAARILAEGSEALDWPAGAPGFEHVRRRNKQVLRGMVELRQSHRTQPIRS